MIGRFPSAAALAALVATTTPLVAQAPPCDEGGWTEIVSAHLARYPLLGVEDAYKLIHQGVFGTEHAAPDVATASAMLEEELTTLGAGGGPPEPITEPIAPGGAVVRVHLRPFLEAGGNPESLLIAFLQTASRVRGDLDDFRCVAAVVERVAGGRWSEGVWRGFVERMLEAGLPAISHSEPFEAVRRPAYRVVAADFLPTLDLPTR